MSSKKDIDFNKATEELKDITEYLESDEVNLEEAIKRYKRGSELADEIKAYLDEAENTIRSIKNS
jgi:exodeoxyribonuclease VII small subunit